jgi:hypothetical protein
MTPPNLVHNPGEFRGRFESSQTIFQVLGDSQSAAVPCGKFAKQHARTLGMLLLHQFKMLFQKLHLLVRAGVRIRTVPGFRVSLDSLANPSEDPGIQHGSAPYRDSGTSRVLQHLEGIVDSSHISVGNHGH